MGGRPARQRADQPQRPFNLDSVEVIKGPNSVFGGSGTTGGSINMISKQPKSTDSTEIAARLGTDRYKRLTVDTNQTLGSEGFAAFRLNLMAHGNDVPGRDQIYKRRWGVAPSLTLGMNGPTRLTLSFLHQTDDNLPDFGVPALYASGSTASRGNPISAGATWTRRRFSPTRSPPSSSTTSRPTSSCRT